MVFMTERGTDVAFSLATAVKRQHETEHVVGNDGAHERLCGLMRAVLTALLAQRHRSG